MKYSMNYEEQDLLPIVARLAERYTHKDSSSVTYEAAAHLMDAVRYCIDELDEESSSVNAANDEISAAAAYEAGKQIVLQKADNVRKIMNRLSTRFCSYGNRNYQDTVQKGITAFLTHYDTEFSPQDAIITMDYPILNPHSELQGVDAVLHYIKAVDTEQRFLGELSDDYVVTILSADNPDYADGFHNISAVVFRSLLTAMLLRIAPDSCGVQDKGNYLQLSEWIAKTNKEQRTEQLDQTLRVLVLKQYKGNAAVYRYFANEIATYVTELENAYHYGTQEHVVVL